MARAAKTEQTGAIGINETLGKFERIGFGHAEVIHHDNGSDVFLLIRDVRRFDLGLTLAAQVKGGDSFLKRRAIAEDGTLLGWWFEDSDGDHIADWLNFGLPHLLVLYDVYGTREAYWVQVTGDAVQSTGKGDKILVPVEQKVDAESREALISVAAEGRPAQAWEGSSWRGTDSIASRDLIRHALLAPRLVAPHPNAHIAKPLSAAQAIGMVAQARIVDLHHLEEHHLVPTTAAAGESDEWAWRLYAAVHRRVTTGDVDVLRGLLESATGPVERATAAAAAAGCLFEEDRADEAVDLLKRILDEDEAEPVDHAWLSVQLARGYAQIGRAVEARERALSVLGVAATHSHDVTATAIGGVGANMLFALHDWTADTAVEVDTLASAIEGSDTAVSWWRQQVAGWATSAALEREFVAWTRDTTTRWARWDAANDQLLAASLNATLIGDNGHWTALTGLLAKDTLVRLNRTSDPKLIEGGLTELRLAGRHQDIVIAARRFVEDGPAEAVAAAAPVFTLDAVTHTTAQSSLALLRTAGRTLDGDTADATVHWILQTLTDPVAFEERVRPTFTVSALLVDTLGSVLQSAGGESQRLVAAHIAGLPALSDDLVTQSWTRLLPNLDPEAWTAEDADGAARRNGDEGSDFRDTLVATVAGRSDAARDAALAVMQERVQPAISAWRDLKGLPDKTVDSIAAKLIAGLARRKEQSPDGGIPVRAFDYAHTLTVLNLIRPSSANWQPLVDYLADNGVAAHDKAAAFGALAGLADKVPATHLGALRTAAKSIQDSESLVAISERLRAGVSGRIRLFLAATGDNTEFSSDIFTLLSSGVEVDRMWAARIAWYLATSSRDAEVGALLVLAQDADPHVRGTAAAGLLAVSSARGVDTAVLRAAIEAAVSDGGVVVPLALATRLAEEKELSPLARQVAERLRSHPLKVVRDRVEGTRG